MHHYTRCTQIYLDNMNIINIYNCTYCILMCYLLSSIETNYVYIRYMYLKFNENQMQIRRQIS